MTGMLLSFPCPPDPNSLTPSDLREITRRVAALPGPWLIDVTVDSDAEDGPGQVTMSVYLGRIDHTVPCFTIRRNGDRICVRGHKFDSNDVMHSSIVGEFATVAAACDALQHDISLLAEQWTIGTH